VDADSLAAAARSGFTRLGAVVLLKRFEEEWAER
jgi:hypothetical protein